jgi:hypothetical protein
MGLENSFTPGDLWILLIFLVFIMVPVIIALTQKSINKNIQPGRRYNNTQPSKSYYRIDEKPNQGEILIGYLTLYTNEIPAFRNANPEIKILSTQMDKWSGCAEIFWMKY